MAARSPHIRMRDVSRVYDALELGIIIADGNGTIIWGNRYYSSLAQFDIRDYFGQNVRKISQREDVILPTERYMIDTVLETRQQQTQIVRYPTQDYVLTTATPILNKAGEIDYIIYSVSNYSDLMRLQEKSPSPGSPCRRLPNLFSVHNPSGRLPHEAYSCAASDG